MAGTSDDMSGAYTPEFYDRIGEESLASARIVVPRIQQMFAAKSVIDFGCGTGAWLRAFEETGATDILGLDFGEVQPDQLAIAPDNFRTKDLSQTITLDRRFDIAVSLEVAEHLPEEAAATFVGNLVRHADIIIFSAAIPGQLGNGHINCQYPSYWAELFSHHMFMCFDPLRPLIWDEDTIPFWYRQNMLVFINRRITDDYPQICGQRADWIDLVHPAMLAHTRDHFRTRLDKVHARNKERVREAREDVWAKARTHFGSGEASD